MRPNLDHLELCRRTHPILGRGEGHCGWFVFVIEEDDPNAQMRILSSRDKDWEHVSVSFPNRAPSWAEMCVVKDMFWRPDETVMQLHVPANDHISWHDHCLHLWKPRQGKPIPRPEPWRVAPAKAKPNILID